MRQEFIDWLCRQEVTDDIEGDFIDDTKTLVSVGKTLDEINQRFYDAPEIVGEAKDKLFMRFIEEVANRDTVGN